MENKLIEKEEKDYARFAKEALKEGIDPEDTQLAISTFRELRHTPQDSSEIKRISLEELRQAVLKET